MPQDKILTWADFRDERVGALGSIWHNREPSYAHFLCRVWETNHDGHFEPADLPAKPASLPVLLSYVDWGRWLIRCVCGAPSVAEVGEDYLCPICEDWHSVEFPSLKSVIERNLLAIPGHRHRAQNRYWRP